MRDLTEQELIVLAEVQEFWGPQNTETDVFAVGEEVCIFAKDRAGNMQVGISLTNLGDWYADGSLSMEQLKRWVMGPAAEKPAR